MKIETGGRWLVIGNIVLNTETITRIEVVESDKHKTHSIAFYSSVKDKKFCAFYKENSYMVVKYRDRAARINNFLLNESEFSKLKGFVLENLTKPMPMIYQ